MGYDQAKMIADGTREPSQDQVTVPKDNCEGENTARLAYTERDLLSAPCGNKKEMPMSPNDIGRKSHF